MPGGSESRLGLLGCGWTLCWWWMSFALSEQHVISWWEEREREIEGGGETSRNDDNSRTYHQTLLDVVRIQGMDGSNGKLRKRRRGFLFSFSFDWREKWRKIYDLAVSQVGIMRKPEDGEKKNKKNSGWNFIRGGDLNAPLGSCCSYSSHLLGTVHFLIPIVQIAHARAWDHSIFGRLKLKCYTI